MFSALNLGSLVYVLDKTDKLKFKIGEVVSISQPRTNMPNFNGLNNNSTVVDMKVTIDGSTYEYNSIPSSFSVITYNNGKLTISETKQGLQQEVENILQNSKLILENLDLYKLNVIDCESLLKQLNPQFAKEKERDDRLNTLEEKFTGVENKLDLLLTIVTNK